MTVHHLVLHSTSRKGISFSRPASEKGFHLWNRGNAGGSSFNATPGCASLSDLGEKNLKETAYKMKKNLSSSLCIYSHISSKSMDDSSLSKFPRQRHGSMIKKRKEKKVWTVHRSCITPTTRGWNSRIRTACESDCQYASETCRFPRG